MVRLAFLGIGLFLLLAGSLVPTEPFPEGGRTLASFAVGALGIAIVLGVGAARGFGNRSGAMVGLFLAGAAAALVLTEPHWLNYTYVRPFEWRATERLAALAVVLLQAAVIAVVFARRRRLRSSARDGALTRPRLAAAILLLLAAGAHVTLLVPRSGDAAAWALLGLQYATTALFAGLAAATLHLAVDAADALALLRIWRHTTAVFGIDAERGSTTVATKALVWSLAAIVTFEAARRALVTFDGVSHIPDGIAYVFQARCYAAGRIFLAAPPTPEALAIYLVDVRDGKWFGVTNPGWPLVLSLGSRCGAEWIVNPLLGGSTIPMVHALARRLLGRGAALGAAILTAASPWLGWLAASDMTHTLSLFLLLGAWLLLMRANASLGTAAWMQALAAGAALGFLCLVRPLDGALTGILTAVALVALSKHWALLAPFGLGGVLGVLGFVPFNRALTGRATSFAINDYLDRLWYPGANRMGFGADVGNPPVKWGLLDPFPGHGLRDVLLNTNQNLVGLNFETFGFAFGSLALPLIALLSKRRDRRDLIAAGFAVLMIGAYNLYWFSGGPDFGARYWFLIYPALLWLTIRGFGAIRARYAAALGEAEAAPRAALLGALLVIGAVAVFSPWRAEGKYKDYRGFHGDYVRLSKSEELRDALVFVRTTRESEWASAFLANPIDLESSRPLFVRDRGETENEAVAKAFPARRPATALGRDHDRPFVTLVHSR